MNSIQRLTILSKIGKALDDNDYGKVAEALGIVGEMYDSLPIEELLQIITVRLSDLMKGHNE